MKSLAKSLATKIPFFNKLIFSAAVLLSRVIKKKEVEFDSVFILANKGWILEGFCRDTAAHMSGSKHFHHGVKKIPRAKIYYFSHHSLFFPAVIQNPHILQYKNVVQYTHYSKPDYLSDSDVAMSLNHATAIFNMNSSTAVFLETIGVVKEKLQVNYIGVDETIFFPKKKINVRPSIGFNLRYESRSSYSNRKNYNLIIEIIKQVNFCDVILLGKNWKECDRFSEIKDLPNFTYVECSYREYPKYYRSMDIFVSVSKLEGGPVPMLEAMFCNVFPVVSKTGFATDLIKQDENGILFEANSSIEEIIKNIERGFSLIETKKVADSVKHLTWKRFAEKIMHIAYIDNIYS